EADPAPEPAKRLQVGDVVERPPALDLLKAHYRQLDRRAAVADHEHLPGGRRLGLGLLVALFDTANRRCASWQARAIGTGASSVGRGEAGARASYRGPILAGARDHLKRDLLLLQRRHGLAGLGGL